MLAIPPDKWWCVLVSPIRRKEKGAVVWICPYQIGGISSAEVGAARGEDSLQVLELVLVAVRATLESADGDFYWMDPDIGIGIAARIPWEFGRETEQNLGRLVEEEITRMVHSRRDGLSDTHGATEAT